MSRFVADVKVSGASALWNGAVLGAVVALLIGFIFAALALPMDVVLPMMGWVFFLTTSVAFIVQVPYLAQNE